MPALETGLSCAAPRDGERLTQCGLPSPKVGTRATSSLVESARDDEKVGEREREENNNGPLLAARPVFLIKETFLTHH